MASAYIENGQYNQIVCVHAVGHMIVQVSL